jgi:hypothetical protein
LGNSVRQWKDLWVSNSTIYLNSLPITADGANLKVNGNTVLTTSSPLSFSNLSVTGNVSANAVYTNNYFYANGAPFPQGSNSLPGTTISLKDNVIATTTLNQNLVLSANGVGNVQTNSSIMPDATQVRDIGSASNKFNSIYAGYYYGNGSQLTGIVSSYGNANVVANLAALGSNPVSTTGNISGNYFIGNGSQLTGISTQVTGSWTLAAGTNTVSLTVRGPGTYSIWVNGNIPNGIVTYTATIVVTNTNVPVVGSSYGWYYAAGNALVLTSIPNQIVGTENNISTAVVATTTANVFTFGITNNSGTSQIVNYGYTKL